MKKILLSVSAAVLSLSAAFAQPTLTSTTNYLVGDSYLAYVSDTFDVGSPGAALTWDFSTLANSGSQSVTYTVCSANANCSSFLGTDVVEDFQGGTATAFYHETSTALSICGEFQTGVIPFTDYEDILRYPFTYNSTYVDPFVAQFTSGSPIYRFGTITVTGDAYGTLILPTGTYNNTLRVHRVEDYQDSVVGAAVLYHYLSDIYTWYIPNGRELLLDLTKFSANGIIFPTHAYYTNLAPSAVENVSNAQSGFSLSPNPVTDKLNIDFNLTSNSNISVTLTDVTGRAVTIAKDVAYNTGQHQLTYNTSALAKGLYLARIQTENGAQTAKVIVQ